LKGRLPDLSQPANSLPESVLHSLLYFFKTHEGFAKQEANVMRALTKHNPTPLSVLPLTEAGASANARIEHIPRITPDPNVLLTKVANSCRVADLLEDLGYSCCSSIATLKEVLQQFPALREADVASIVALMVRTYSGLEDSVGLALFTPGASADGPPEAPVQPQSWNVNVFVDTVKELQPKLNWHAVAKSLDMPGFYIPDQKGFTILLNVFKRATKEPFPISVAYDNWTNTKVISPSPLTSLLSLSLSLLMCIQ
jgi:CCR4-NOT transcription complex subunit 1